MSYILGVLTTIPIAGTAGIVGGVHLATWHHVCHQDDPKLFPFNWRVFFGPSVYTRWVLRQHGVDVLNPIKGWDD